MAVTGLPFIAERGKEEGWEKPQAWLSGVVRSGVEKELTRRAIKDLRIKTPSGEQTAKNLSGGNQQKVVLGKWLVRDARVVIFDEPTRGIDVASKVEIYSIMNDLKSRGIGVLFVSSEMPEVMGMSDRILVMCNGRITGNLVSKATTQDEILRCATQYNVQPNVQSATEK